MKKMATFVFFLLLIFFLPANLFGECIEGNCENGQGTKIVPTGKYVGEWKDGKYNGHGTVTSSYDGRKYVGDFKDGKKHGKGTYTYPDVVTYVGEWKDDKPHGKGTAIYSDGRKSVGEFKEGKYVSK